MDVKLLSKALAYHIKKVLPKIIHSNQSGHVEGRFIGETLRTIDDIMEFTKCEGIGGILSFLDCVIPENIHTPTTEDNWKFRGRGGVKGQ